MAWLGRQLASLPAGDNLRTIFSYYGFGCRHTLKLLPMCFYLVRLNAEEVFQEVQRVQHMESAGLLLRSEYRSPATCFW